MNERRGARWTTAVAVALFLTAPPAWAETAKVSGTIVAVDKEAGTIVVGEVGPWRVKGEATEVTSRTIAVTSETAFKLARRAAGAGPTGWVGEFVEGAIAPWQVKPGDFVTVEFRRDGERLTAVRIVVTVPESP